jgi:hypothetical protein
VGTISLSHVFATVLVSFAWSIRMPSFSMPCDFSVGHSHGPSVARAPRSVQVSRD